MLLRILDTPILDVLLILLAIRFIWPQLFGIRRGKPSSAEKKQEKIFVKEQAASPKTNSAKDQGEYIEYEEIK